MFLKVEPEGLADHWKRRVSKDINPLLLIFRNMDWNWEYLKVYILCLIQDYHKLKQIRVFQYKVPGRQADKFLFVKGLMAISQ